MAKKAKRTPKLTDEEKAAQKRELRERMRRPLSEMTDEEAAEAREYWKKVHEKRLENAHIPRSPVQRLMRKASGGSHVSREAVDEMITILEGLIGKVTADAKSDANYARRTTIQTKDIKRAIQRFRFD